jgi:hypothetical protein
LTCGEGVSRERVAEGNRDDGRRETGTAERQTQQREGDGDSGRRETAKVEGTRVWVVMDAITHGRVQ